MTETVNASQEAEDYIGRDQWHSSEEGGGPDVGHLLTIGADKHLWVGEITKARWEEAGTDAAELGDDFGFGLILYDGGDVTVLGKFLSPEDGRTLVEEIASALRQPDTRIEGGGATWGDAGPIPGQSFGDEFATAAPPLNKSPTPEHVEGDVLSVGEIGELVSELERLSVERELHMRADIQEDRGISTPPDIERAAMKDCSVLQQAISVLTSATTRIQSQANQIAALMTERKSLIATKREQISELTERAELAESAEWAAKDCFWAVYPTYCKTVGHGVSTEAARTMLSTRATTAEAQLADAVKVLKEMVDTLTPAEYASGRDPAYGDRVRAIGSEIGFGALMSCASTEWRLWLEDNGYPVGSEFVSGPCRSVLQSDLLAARAFLSSIGEKPDAE